MNRIWNLIENFHEEFWLMRLNLDDLVKWLTDGEIDLSPEGLHSMVINAIKSLDLVYICTLICFLLYHICMLVIFDLVRSCLTLICAYIISPLVVVMYAIVAIQIFVWPHTTPYRFTWKKSEKSKP